MRMWTERDDVGRFADRRKIILAEHLHQRAPGEAGEIQLGGLREPRQVHDHEDRLLFMPAEKREHLVVFREEKLERAARERPEIFPHRDDAPRPPKQRGEVLLLVLDVDRFVVILGIDRDRQIELLRIRLRETGVAVRAPLHRGAAAVAISEIKIVAHPDFVAVVKHRRSRHGEEKNIQQLDFAAVVCEQRREAAADTEIDPRRGIVRINAPHVIALLVRHHLERQLIVVAQEHGPLAVLGNRRRLVENIEDREPVLHLERHEHPRHQREMEIHVRLVALAEIRDGVFRPLVRLGEQHAAAEFLVHVGAEFNEILVGLAQIFADGSFALVEVRNGIEPQAVDAHAQPEIEHLLDRFVHGRVVEIQIGLVRIETVPVIRFRDRVPGPVRSLEVFKDDARFLVFFRRVAPDIHLTLGRTGRGPARFLEPRVLI